MFHLFLSASLANVITVENPTWKGLLSWRSNRLQTIYFTSYRMLRIATLSYLIHRFVRVWSNTSGQCFIPFEGGTGSPDEVNPLVVGMGISIAFDTCSIILALVEVKKAISCRSKEEKDTVAGVQDTEAASTDNQKTKDTGFWTKRKKSALFFLAKFKPKTQNTGYWNARPMPILIFLAKLLLRGCFLIWDAGWTASLVLTNKTHILGDEYIFSFGQVGALVTLAASFYKIGNSYLGKPCVPS
jgi:hypothetical protein